MCDSNELKNYFHRFIFVWIYTDFFNFNIFLQNGSWNYLLIMKSLYTYIVCGGGYLKKIVTGANLIYPCLFYIFELGRGILFKEPFKTYKEPPPPVMLPVQGVYGVARVV